MRDFALVTLTRFPEIFNCLDSSVINLGVTPKYKIVVTSGPHRDSPYTAGGKAGVNGDWNFIKGIEPFNFARNANLALSACRGMDILLVNDDVQFTDALTPVMGIVDSNLDVGIVAPQVIGGIGNNIQSANYKINGDFEISEAWLAFVCVYIRREVLSVINFDERTFCKPNEITYGSEDVDFCLRTQQLGYNLVVTPSMTVKHGFGKHTFSSSFLQVMTPAQRNQSMFEMQHRLKEKFD